MIIPCIDLQDGKAVQLVQGRKLALSVDDVLGLLQKFAGYPILHVIDLDAALRKGENGALIRELCQRAGMEVRVGGGIRTAAHAKKAIVGSAIFKDGAVSSGFLRTLAKQVGKDHLIFALDSKGGRIVVRGWTQRLMLRPQDVIPQIEPYCAGFLCTYVDNEGTMKGTNLDWFRKLRRITSLPITAAGGIRSKREVRALEKIDMHAAIGMALYTGKLS
jgi:phosphoribosylformimino-5-aminoimidazole carboxamide ribotide isomerase